MEKTYTPQHIEQKWYDIWEKQGYFAPQNAAPSPSQTSASSYCIMIPPPNVTGSLHMGHGFQDTLMDALTRYHRMKGENTLWQMGTDHAGISTQMVVEWQLAKDNISRHELGRDAFVDKIWEWKQRSGGNIARQMRRLGTSVDWQRERFTLDKQLSKAVLDVFVKLYDEGLIYRGKRLVNWDPHFCSAISDLEVINHQEQGHLWHFRYPFADNPSEYLVIATTRPETMLGDTAVAVHPDDPRYQPIVGRQIKLPLTNRLIPVIADSHVDPAFGSGCVKITPAHDFNDYAVGQRHHLPCINIFTPDAKINDNGSAAYRGMDRFEARRRIVADLRDLALLEKMEDHTLNIPRADRGNTIVEPYLTDQWFVKTAPLAKPAIDAVRSGKIRMVPEKWRNTYYQWMENIEDWCISRQLWWGHRIPAWYDDAGNIYVAHSESEVRKKYRLAANLPLTQEEDVLDTWFSSALWPFSTLGWPDNTRDFNTFYPTSVLVTGFDIIFFWVARMIMMGLKFTGKVPFHEVYFTGLIRDSEGQKMSKSKGNVLDPIDLIDGIDLESLVKKRIQGLMQPRMAKSIEKSTRQEFRNGIPAFGTDALRFTYCALASTGRDIRFDLQRLEGYRNFCNKIWNAARYVMMNVHDVDNAATTTREYSLADSWIQSRLQEATAAVRESLDNYRFDLAAQTLYEFIWHEFCDWYLELSKPVLNDDTASAAAKAGTRDTLVTTLESLLRLLHPFMPFITEEIWQQLKPCSGKKGATIMLEPYPQVDSARINSNAEENVSWLKKVINSVRNIRGEMHIAPGRLLPLFINKASTEDKIKLQHNTLFLLKLARLESITLLTEQDAIPACATALAGTMECLIPLAGLIDVTAEIRRLQKEMAKLTRDLHHATGKLANEKFISNAPENVVAAERSRVRELTEALEKLQEKAAELQTL